jgi:hypothetical protein
VRDRRELLRDLHKQAMNEYIFSSKYKNMDKNKHFDNDKKYINRNTIRSIKKKIVLNDDKYQCLKNQFYSNKSLEEE